MARAKKVVKEVEAELLPPIEHLAPFPEEFEVEHPTLPEEEDTGLKTFDNNITVLEVSNPTHHGDGSITMNVLFKHIGIVIPFAAHPSDEFEHGRWLYEEAMKGTFGEIAEWDRPLPSVHDLQVELDKLMPDVMLGIATDEELSLAKALRLQIKAMS